VQAELCRRVETAEIEYAANDVITNNGPVLLQKEVSTERAKKVVAVLQGGRVFEKAGIGLTVMTRTLTPRIAKQMASNHVELREKLHQAGVLDSKGTAPGTKDGDAEGATRQLRMWVCGLSTILHPVNPWVPTVHFNYRYFEVTREKEGSSGEEEIVASWFGGGADLTPIYLIEEDAHHFHKVLKSVCDKHDNTSDSDSKLASGSIEEQDLNRKSHGEVSYRRFKRWADEYFFNAARGEARGIGGIFFDDLSTHDRTRDLAFVQDCAEAFIPAYWPILEKRKDKPFGDMEKVWQRLRHGRYVEYNLVYDRGTKFGFAVPGVDIEVVLMSLPQNVMFEFRNNPAPGSKERKLLDVLTSPPRDWA
jgi:coproporphyrinogen III oxidase